MHINLHNQLYANFNFAIPQSSTKKIACSHLTSGIKEQGVIQGFPNSIEGRNSLIRWRKPEEEWL